MFFNIEHFSFGRGCRPELGFESYVESIDVLDLLVLLQNELLKLLFKRFALLLEIFLSFQLIKNIFLLLIIIFGPRFFWLFFSLKF